MDKGGIVLRFTEGLLNQEKYMLLKKLAAAYGGYRILILAVSPDDIETLGEMVTSVCLSMDEKAVCDACSDITLMTMVKKLSIASKYMISGFKAVVDYGGGREERDCTFSIKTPCAHIHVPMDMGDKKTERYISSALESAKVFCDDGKSNMLIYYDAASDKTISESKDDYVRRKYFESGIINNEN